MVWSRVLSMKKDKLVLGPGKNDYGAGWVHVDRADLEHIDEVHDLDTGKLPVPSNQFRFIKARHVLEHVRDGAYVDLMREVARVARPDALFYVVVPHFLSWNAHTVDHERKYGRRSFGVFTPGHGFVNQFPDLFELENIHYEFYSSKYVDEMIEKYGDKAVAAHVGNAVNEMVFELRVL
jgi:predicted SAM-dependent methyltransferase